MSLRLPAEAEPADGKKTLTRALWTLKGLRALNLSQNCFKACPPGLSSLTNLQYLDMSHCKDLKVWADHALASAAPCRQPAHGRLSARAPAAELLLSICNPKAADCHITAGAAAHPCSNPVALLAQHTRLPQIQAPLTPLLKLPRLQLVDLRGVHDNNAHLSYWDADKCTAMSHLAALSKALKKRPAAGKLLMDVE